MDKDQHEKNIVVSISSLNVAERYNNKSTQDSGGLKRRSRNPRKSPRTGTEKEEEKQSVQGMKGNRIDMLR